MAELECDQAAVRAGFAPHFVAQTILKMLKANRLKSSPAGVLNYAGDNSSENLRVRIGSLISGRPQPTGAAPLGILLGALLGIGFGFLLEVHHALETVLGWLT